MNQSSIPLESFELGENAQLIQAELKQLICQAIDSAGGCISFSEFMNQALYQPSLGYYQNELQTFGDKGDFITAPEMGKYFALCLANSLSAVLRKTDSSSQKTIVELGAGSGALMVNLMQALEKQDTLPDEYLILEPSANLQKQQKEKIAGCSANIQQRVVWVSELPKNINGVILANEVVDAIPFKRIQRADNQWLELGVTHAGGNFEYSAMQAMPDNHLPTMLKESTEQNSYSSGYTTEVRPLVNGWINSLASSLESGKVLLIDYGYASAEYYHLQRTSGTLTCFIRHHQHDDPSNLVGLQDITAHVDFTELALAASKSGLDVSGYTTQAGFLLENGITEIAEQQLTNQPEEFRYQISQELQKLLMPGQMGEVIKVICFSKSSSEAINGFAMQDHLHRL